MKIFKCQSCGQLIYFDNVRCENCNHRLGYLPEPGVLSALEPDDETWRPLAEPEARYRFCVNAEHDTCNWLVPAGSEERFCTACRHNRTIPDLAVDHNWQHWKKFEIAKHRLFYSLIRLDLPLANRVDDPEEGLVFDFLADPPNAESHHVMTGHDNGLITINLKEAEDHERERLRNLMGESYRTILGHFRHEIGHYFWDRLVRDEGRLEECRALFGDDRKDYQSALQRHYADGAPADWQQGYISRYATSHPWEDFAETWAHYLHIVDTLESASAFGISIDPVLDGSPLWSARLDFDPYEAGDRPIERLIDVWLPLTFAMNAINRAMGEPDLYPFILTPPVIAKLGFIHELIHARRHAAEAAPLRDCA
jgi:hypothetical protein